MPSLMEHFVTILATFENQYFLTIDVGSYLFMFFLCVCDPILVKIKQ